MKHLLLSVSLALASVLAVPSASYAKVFSAPSTKVYVDSTTTHQYELNGRIYPIYKSKKGRYYIYRVSKKTNRQYKYYIPKNIQKQIEQYDKK